MPGARIQIRKLLQFFIHGDCPAVATCKAMIRFDS